MSDPHRAVKAVIDAEMPISRYRVMQRFNKVMGPHGTFVTPTVEEVEVPNFWSTEDNMFKVWKHYKSKFEIEHSGGPADDSYMWNLLKCLQFIYDSKTYMTHVRDPLNLEIIVRSDGMPVGSSHACFLLMTLGNFDELSKCLGFNFCIYLAEVSEKN